MICKRCLPGLLAMFLCAWAFPVPAQAQGPGAPGVDADALLTALTSAPDDQVALTRRQIADLLSKNAAAAAAVEAKLAPALDSDRPIVRLNGAMLLADLVNADPAGSALPLITQGIKTTGLGSPAVHYWAAKAAAALLRKGKLAADKQAALAKDLLAAAGSAATPSALQQMLAALAYVDNPDVTKQLLDIIDQRLAAHLKNLNLSIAPECEALRTLFLARNDPTAPRVGLPNDLVVRIARSAFCYMDFAGQVLDPTVIRTPPEGQKADLVQMLAVGDLVLLWAADKVSAGKAPDSIKNDLVAKPLPIAKVRLQIEYWRGLLTDPAKPFKIPTADVTVTLPKAE